MLAAPIPFTVRDATDADAPRLRQLMAASATASGVRWCIEAAKDPFATLRAEREGWTLSLAEDDCSQLLGFISVATRWAFANGQPLRCCYVTGLKVLSEHRGRGIGDALCRRALEFCRVSGGESIPILMVIRNGNSDMSGRVTGRRGLPTLPKFADVQVHSILARQAATLRADDIEVGQATPADLDEMAEFSRRVASQRQFATGFNTASLVRWIEGAPGLALGDFTVARSRGRIVGWTGWWDEMVVRVSRIAGYTFTGAMRHAMQHATSLLRGCAPPAGVGSQIGCLRAVHTFVPATRPQVLRALVADAARRRGHDCSWLQIAFDARDPLAHALHGLRTHAAAFGAHLTCPSGVVDRSLMERSPLHLDAALI